MIASQINHISAKYTIKLGGKPVKMTIFAKFNTISGGKHVFCQSFAEYSLKFGEE
jgi:hypothetical protein